MGKQKKSGHQKKVRSKQILVFDEHLRRDYLSGFTRRKQHRKCVAKEEAETRTREARLLVKAKYRELLKDSLPMPAHDIRDMHHESTASVYDLPEHTVTITDVTYVDLSGSDGRLLGQNTFESEDEGEDQDEVSDPATVEDKPPVRCIMKSLRGELTKLELQKPRKKKKYRNMRKAPSKKGAHKRRNNKK